MAKKVLAPNARFLLSVGCDIVVGNLRFYKVKESDNYRMLVFDENSNLLYNKEKNFKNIDECLLMLIDSLPEEPEDESR